MALAFMYGYGVNLQTYKSDSVKGNIHVSLNESSVTPADLEALHANTEQTTSLKDKADNTRKQ